MISSAIGVGSGSLVRQPSELHWLSVRLNAVPSHVSYHTTFYSCLYFGASNRTPDEAPKTNTTSELSFHSEPTRTARKLLWRFRPPLPAKLRGQQPQLPELKLPHHTADTLPTTLWISPSA